ncbi:MAG: DnaJ C-terminal domain-containing protein [Sporichthyaceae bacterium]
MTAITWLERDRWSTGPRDGSGALPYEPALKPLTARFEGQGSDLVLVVAIRASEAEHGAMISVPAPGADVRMRIPPGTTSGRHFRLPRHNAPAPDGFGDLLVRVDVVA